MTTATDEVRAALERLRSLVVGCEMQAGPSAFVVVQCVDLKAALDELAARAERAEAERDALREALLEMRDYAAARILSGGAHHDPVWPKVAGLLEASHER